MLRGYIMQNSSTKCGCIHCEAIKAELVSASTRDACRCVQLQFWGRKENNTHGRFFPLQVVAYSESAFSFYNKQGNVHEGTAHILPQQVGFRVIVHCRYSEMGSPAPMTPISQPIASIIFSLILAKLAPDPIVRRVKIKK